MSTDEMANLRQNVKLAYAVGILTGLLTLGFLNRTSHVNECHNLQQNFITIRRPHPPVDCLRLFQNDETEQQKALLHQEWNPKIPTSNQEYISMTTNCDRFIIDRDYITKITSEDEKDFPLAFSLLLYNDIELFERLLRAIYRPQNIYCIHVDKKSGSFFHEAVHAIAKCFDKVFVLQNSVNVTWGTFTVLEPEILCMEALLKYKKWKYFINLTGQEFPLKTNWELVQILKSLNGSNVAGATVRRMNKERLTGRPPPPISVTPVKGSVHVVVRREFVEFAINDVRGQMLVEWSKVIGVPDEMYFAILNHNPQLGIPGSYLGQPEPNGVRYPVLSRYKIWKHNNSLCHGKYVRSICIFGVGDLPSLGASRQFFANKFHLNYQPLALDCLEQLVYNRTLQESNGWKYFDTTYYRNLDMVKNHV